MHNIGTSDRPILNIENDELKIQPYVEGLAEFIKECETPMTISIQGDWGCGKTSTMNMLNALLDNSTITVWFNTWQFSQFDKEKVLAITFLQHLTNELYTRVKGHANIENTFCKLKLIFTSLASATISHFLGDTIGNAVAETCEIASAKEIDSATELVDLKTEFQNLIRAVTNKENKRIVLFIDDLDRLSPVRAVELLEILKLFVDCEDCVFVMAIDTSVVFQGIREKYGQNISDTKAQSFFDKMIQLPFKMPTANYQLDALMDRLLNFFLDKKVISPNDKSTFINLLKYATDGNPRSIKRLINSIILLNKVAIKKGIYTDEPSEDKTFSVKMLFVLSCIQHKFAPVYDFIVKSNEEKFLAQLIKHPLTDTNDKSKCALEIYDFLLKKGLDSSTFDIQSADKVAFSELLQYFIKSIQLYTQVDDGTRMQKCKNIINLNNLDTSIPVTKEIHSPDPDSLSDELYAKIFIEEKPQEALALLEEKGVYINPIFGFFIDKVTEFPPAAKNYFNQYREQQHDAKNIKILQKLNNMLEQYCKKVDTSIAGATYRFKELYIIVGHDANWNAKCRMMFSSPVHLLNLKYELDKMFGSLRERYLELQMTYGKLFFKDESYIKLELHADDPTLKDFTFIVQDTKSVDIIAKFISYVVYSPDSCNTISEHATTC